MREYFLLYEGDLHESLMGVGGLGKVSYNS